jgi:hypothetical protein
MRSLSSGSVFRTFLALLHLETKPFTGLSSHQGFVLKVNGEVVDQSTHGNDFWQTDYDAKTKT